MLHPISPRISPPGQRGRSNWGNWLVLSIAFFVVSSFGVLQFNLLPFSTGITNMKQYLADLTQLTHSQQHRDKLLEHQVLEDGGKSIKFASTEDQLIAKYGLTDVCSDAYREEKYKQIEGWGYPPLFEGTYDFPVCEDWTVHELLGSWRDRGLTDIFKTIPCDVWKAIRGRTTWFIGDSQNQYFYRTLRAIVTEPFLEEDGVKDEPLTTDPALEKTLKDKVFLDYDGGVGMPLCTRYKGNTRVCYVRVNMGWHFTEQYMPQMNLFNASVNDFLVYNTGLWHHKRDGQYESIIKTVTRLWQQHKKELPIMFWRDNSPQHFDIEYGEFPHPEEVGEKLKWPIECKPMENLTIDAQGYLHGNSEHVQAGGWRNIISEPIIDASGMYHFNTWNESALWWRMHTRQENGNIECTHFCGPGPYNVWIYQWLKELQRLRNLGDLPPPTFVPVSGWQTQEAVNDAGL